MQREASDRCESPLGLGPRSSRCCDPHSFGSLREKGRSALLECGPFPTGRPEGQALLLQRAQSSSSGGRSVRVMKFRLGQRSHRSLASNRSSPRHATTAGPRHKVDRSRLQGRGHEPGERLQTSRPRREHPVSPCMESRAAAGIRFGRARRNRRELYLPPSTHLRQHCPLCKLTSTGCAWRNKD